MAWNMKKIAVLLTCLLAAALLAAAAEDTPDEVARACDLSDEIMPLDQRWKTFEGLSERLTAGGVEVAGIVVGKDGRPVVLVDRAVESLETARSAAGDGTRVEYACGTAAGYATALDAVRQTVGKETDFVTMPDPVSGRLIVVADAEHPSVKLLRSRDDVLLLDGEVSPDAGSRTSDHNIHYGAAGIRQVNVGTCTSNSVGTFALFNLKIMPTAGHCILNGNVVKSGSHTYGVNAFQKDPASGHDLGGMIAPANQSYADDVWITNTSSSDVNAFGHSSSGSNICLSGRNGQTCLPIVLTSNNSATFNHSGNSYWDLDTAYLAMHHGYCDGGDSGGLYYINNGSGKSVRGLHIAHTDVPSLNLRFCFYHDAYIVQSSLGITFVT